MNISHVIIIISLYHCIVIKYNIFIIHLNTHGTRPYYVIHLLYGLLIVLIIFSGGDIIYFI